ncbi:rhomboid family intramembrane serine protease [Antrihabitans cavernicola]|uniref:Rhomboid family intramembrane serine protease n=1 Tax=Antrihabitans cavernicola TaxID=2495913 RepID=A0A5A7SFM6_9NOCA|nr:rhomboid family intramembrane serine protease [Spelaeibacter cavernicola]KAA0024930.1 rhomboid family intramembrane serine protease [Spelaeibacter cavernicola]
MTSPGGYGPPPGGPVGGPAQPACVRHPDRPTALSCNRCGRPACPECLREAAVGYQCVDCVREGNRSTAQVRTVAGARANSRPTPYVTYALVAINVIVFGVTAAQAHSIMDNQRSALFNSWALYGPAVGDGQLIRVLGSGFLHFGPIHLLANMFALYIVGRDVELILGRARYAAVYFVALLGGSASVLALQPNAATAGASGAIFGLFGAQAVILLRLKQSPGPVLAIIFINVVISVSLPGISLWGHMGGLAAGTIATAGLLFGPGLVSKGGQSTSSARTIGWVSVAAVAVIVIGVILLRMTQLHSQLAY